MGGSRCELERKPKKNYSHKALEVCVCVCILYKCMHAFLLCARTIPLFKFRAGLFINKLAQSSQARNEMHWAGEITSCVRAHRGKLSPAK
jgi:hypothetical protein